MIRVPIPPSLLPLVLILPACVVAQGETPLGFEDIVADHRKRADYADCGVAKLDQTCREELSETERCLLAAFADCAAAEGRVEQPTVEGDPIIEIYFVDPEGGGCSVTRYQDNSADSFKGDYGDFIEFSCVSLSEQAYVPQLTCAAMVPEACQTVQEWDG